MDMSKIEIPEDIAALARKVGRQFKSEQDLADFSRLLKKITVEAALGGEIDDHLGYSKHEIRGRGTGNSRNGYSQKTLKGDHGEVEIDTPRDRNGTFEPQLVRKGQTRLTQFDDQILALYAKGMSTRDIVATFKEMYDADVSPTLISKVTDAVLEQVLEWQSRPLDDIYPIVYLDCIVLKIRQDKRVINKAIYLALGINLEGHKELLGLWMAETEGAKFWLSVLTELQNRGLKDIFIAAVDGLKGFPEAINTVYPLTKIQLCIVHMVRNSLKFVSWKDRKAVAADLKKIYSSLTEEEAEQELSVFAEMWDTKFPSISQSWRRHWPNLITLFDYPDDIRKVIYTTNAIESVNSVIRKAVKNRKVFPHDQAAMKVVYLAIDAAAKKWTMPIRDWKGALNRFMIEFPGRMPETL
jgi:transposase-like protein